MLRVVFDMANTDSSTEADVMPVLNYREEQGLMRICVMKENDSREGGGGRRSGVAREQVSLYKSAKDDGKVRKRRRGE